MKVRLYTVPASHPGKTAAAMLAHKGIPYKRIDLLPFVSRTAVRVLGFPDKTVPAMVIDGRKIQKSRAIGQELDRIQPDPPLYPSDPDQLKKVLEAERFGDEELQSTIRRIVIWGVRHSPEARLSYLQESKLPVPLGLAAKTGGPLIALAARQNEASDEKTRAYLAALPALLQRVDDEIAAGTIDGEELNAADFQIAGEHPAGADDARSEAVDRFAAGRQVRPPRDPGLRRRHAGGHPRGVAGATCRGCLAPAPRASRARDARRASAAGPVRRRAGTWRR